MTDKTNKSTLVIGTMSAAALGLAALTVVTKKDTIISSIENLDQQLYEDGKARVQRINQIKQDVNEHIK